MAKINLNQQGQGADRVMDLLGTLLKNKRDEQNQSRREAHDLKMFNLSGDRYDRSGIRKDLSDVSGFLDNAEWHKARGVLQLSINQIKNNPNLDIGVDLDSQLEDINTKDTKYKQNSRLLQSFFFDPAQPTKNQFENGIGQGDIMAHRWHLLQDADLHPLLQKEYEKNIKSNQFKNLTKFKPYYLDESNYDATLSRELFKGIGSIDAYKASEKYGPTYDKRYASTYENIQAASIQEGLELGPDELAKATDEELFTSLVVPLQNEFASEASRQGIDFRVGYENATSEVTKANLEDAVMTIVYNILGPKYQEDNIRRVGRSEKIAEQLADIEVAEKRQKLEDELEGTGGIRFRKKKRLREELEAIGGSVDGDLDSENIPEAVDVVMENPSISNQIMPSTLGSGDARDEEFQNMLTFGTEEEKQKARMYFSKKGALIRVGFNDPSTNLGDARTNKGMVPLSVAMKSRAQKNDWDRITGESSYLTRYNKNPNKGTRAIEGALKQYNKKYNQNVTLSEIGL